ncbi:hypothetical protein MMC28_007168 [Mycoblastus sanguinarius]|nr:hypothetical protein [Mycoblastus sanguinarius]
MHSSTSYALNLLTLFQLTQAQAPVSSNGLRYCSGFPSGWGDGAPACVSGVSSISGDYSAVMDGFNNEYCNGDWSGDISLWSASFSEGGLTFSLTNIQRQPDNYPYGTTARRPIECNRVYNFLTTTVSNAIGCGDMISYSCDYSPPDLFEDTQWQYTMSLYVNSDLYWVLGNRDGTAPPSQFKGGSSSDLKVRPQALAPEGTVYLQCGGDVTCTSDTGGFILV